METRGRAVNKHRRRGATRAWIRIGCLCLLGSGQTAGQNQTALPSLGPDVGAAAERAVLTSLLEEGFRRQEVVLEPLADPVWAPSQERFAKWGDPTGSPGGGLTGLVRDETGAVVPGVEIEIHSRDRSPRFLRSGSDGSFAVAGIPSGPTDVHFILPGFKRSVFSLTMKSGEIAELLPTLEVGSSSETISMPFPPPRKDVPEAVALVGATLGNVDFRPYLVLLANGSATPVWLREETRARRLPIGRGEWSRMDEELQGFYSDLLDIEAGPNRLLPYLAQDLVDFWRGVLVASGRYEGNRDLPDGESIRHWLCPWFDKPVIDLWRRLANVAPPDRGESDRGLSESDLAAISQLLNRDRDIALIEFQARGILDLGLRREAAPYLSRLLGRGLVTKQDLSEIPELRLGEVYTIKLFPYLRLHFDWRGGHLRIVGMTIDD